MAEQHQTGQMADAQALAAAVREREELMGTGLGSGLAIPHARLAELTKPILLFGRSLQGIEWDAPDGLPVHFVFLLLTPVADEGLQLQILAALARTLNSQDVRHRLEHAADEQAIWFVLQEALRPHQLVPSTGDSVSA